MTEVEDPTLGELIEMVKRLEEGLEALQELIDENHQETLEKLDDLHEGGRGFSTFEP